MINFITLSGWFAVPFHDYMKCCQHVNLSETKFYQAAKVIADARNEFKGTNDEFKLTVKEDLLPIAELVNIHYSIYQFYKNQMY